MPLNYGPAVDLVTFLFVLLTFLHEWGIVH